MSEFVIIPPNDKTYLGDGAYVQIGSFESEVVLTTEDGTSVQNTVVLDDYGILNLLTWLTCHGWKIRLGVPKTEPVYEDPDD